MKKNYSLKICSIILAFQLFFNIANAQIITVSGSQVTAESGVENGAKLFDEQATAGNPKANAGGHCLNNWLPGWITLPHSAYVNLGQVYTITDIYLYDFNGSANVTVETGSPGNWTPVFVDPMSGWMTWNAHPVTLTTQYLRFTTADGDCRAYEVVLYGSVASGGADITAPANVTDLAISSITSSSMMLSWTSPGDDSNTGTATSYDIRYSTNPITNSTDFNTATQATGEPAPLVANSIQTFTVNGLSASTQYYFAIQTSDEVPNTSALSNIVNGTTSNLNGGLPPLTKTYIHLPSLAPQWNSITVYNALEPNDFDNHWASLLGALPAGDGSWNGGNINLGLLGTGYGVVDWNGSTSSNKKPILVQLPSAGAAPATGICPMDNRFIVCSAMNNATSTVNNAADYETALLAIQQMIKNIQASGNATADVFVIGKSVGGGMGLMTAALNSSVKDFFVSVPALAGFNGLTGALGPYPGYASNNTNAYIDAVNHAKRYRNKATFSISYDDNVTWPQGQVTCTKNTQHETTIYHGNDGQADPDWWTNGTTWLNGCLNSVVNNGVGLPGLPSSAGNEIISSEIKVYPNPNNGAFTLHAPKQGTYSVINELGQTVKTFVINNENNHILSIENLDAGIYFIVGVNEGKVARQKVVVTK